GVVQSFQGDTLVLRTADGDHTFHVASNTVRPAAVQANLPVTISYVSENGVDRAVRVVENTQASAESLTPGSSVTGPDNSAATAPPHPTAPSAPWTTPPPAGTNGAPAGSTYGSTATTAPDTTGSTTTGTTGSTYDSTTDTTASTGTTANNLPATGSDAPLMGLF